MHGEADMLALMRRAWESGDPRRDRTGVGTRALFGETLRFDLSDGRVPLLTTKRVFWRSAVKELIWFLSGDTSIVPLVREGVHIWTDWPLDTYRRETGEQLGRDAFEARLLADADFAARWGDLGPVYGKQWRRWLGPDGREHDQIAALLRDISGNPTSRRLLFTGWNVAELGAMALPPCHMTYQYFVGGGRLSGILYQRSCDLGLGFPFNVFEAALLIRMLAAQTGLRPGTLTWMGADVHVYENHGELIETMLAREPKGFPRLALADAPDLFAYTPGHVTLDGYDPHPAIAAPVAV